MLNRHIPSVSIENVSQVSTSNWEAVYASDPCAMPTQSKVWASTILAGSNCRNISRYYQFSDGIEAVLPLFKRSIVPVAVSVLNSPPPAWGYGGALSTAPLSSEHLEPILEDCEEIPGAAISVRPNPQHGAQWISAAKARGWSVAPKTAHVLSLDGGIETVRKARFSGNTRNKIRRAERASVTVDIGNNAPLIASFEALFRRSIDRWARKQNELGWLARLRGHLRDSSKKFRTMAEHAGAMLQIAIASHDGRPVAGAIVLVDQNAHYTRGAMDEDLVGKTYANYLLHAKLIELACDRQCRLYHMGETGQSSSLAQFKGHFGAVAVPFGELMFERLPIYSADRTMRAGIKRLIGFSDV